MSGDQKIEFACIRCQAVLRLAMEHAGKQARCPACQSIVPVPLPPTGWQAPLSQLPETSGPANSSGSPRDFGAFGTTQDYQGQASQRQESQSPASWTKSASENNPSASTSAANPTSGWGDRGPSDRSRDVANESNLPPPPWVQTPPSWSTSQGTPESRRSANPFSFSGNNNPSPFFQPTQYNGHQGRISTSTVLGICSICVNLFLCCGWPLGLMLSSIGLGIIATTQAENRTAAFVLNLVGFCISALIGVIFVLGFVV